MNPGVEPPVEPAADTGGGPPCRGVSTPTWTTLPVTLLVQAAASAAVLAPAVAAPVLLARMDLGPVAIGLYVTLVYLAAMVSSQWGAALVRRWGPIRTSQCSLVFCAVGLLALALPVWPLAALGALLVGWGYGPITPASSEILARSTLPARYALVFSIKQTGVPIGGALAGLLVPLALAVSGPLGALALLGAVCLAGVLLAQGLHRELDRSRDPASPRPTLAGCLAPIRLVLGHAELRSIALCSAVFSAVQVSLTAYLVSFVIGDLGRTLVAAGVALSVAQAGGVVGRVLWGVLADRWQAARAVLAGLTVVMGMAGVALSLLTPQVGSLWLWGLVAVYGASAIGWNGVVLATVARAVPLPQAAAATSGCLFFTYFGVVLGPPLFGVAGTVAGRLGPAFALLALPLAVVLATLLRPGWQARRSRRAQRCAGR